MDKKLLTGDERPRSTEKKVREKLNVKESDEQENGSAPCSHAKQGNDQTELASDKHTSVVGVSEKAVRDVSSGSNDSSPTPNSNRERPRSAKRGRGKSGRGRTSGEKKREFQDGGKESNESTTSSSKIRSVEGVKPFLQTKTGGDSSKSTSSSKEVVKQTSDTRPSEGVKTSLLKSGNTEGQTTSVKETPIAKGSSTINKNKPCMPPPGFAKVCDKGGCQESRNDFRSPPPGFEKRSPRPRPPPGLSKPMEGTEPSASQSIAS